MFLDIKPGAEVVAQGRRYRITHPLDLNYILAQDVLTGVPARVPISDLGDPGGGVARPARTDLARIAEAAWEIAQTRYEAIHSLLDTGIASRQAVNEVARQARVHPATVYRWLRRYERAGEVASLLPGKPGVHGACKRLSAEVETIVEAAIQSRYLNRQRLSAEQICRQVFLECRRAGLKPPPANTVRRRIAAVPEQERILRRQGRRAMKERFSPLLGEFPGADRPLAVVQIDHTKLDIIVVDDQQRLPIGRPWLTLAIDVYSRMVAGFYVSLDPPGALSAGLCLVHAILPKEACLAQFGLASRWPVWGLMASVHCDNAKEFRGAMLKRACENYGIEMRFQPVATPHYGGHIERMLGTVATEIHALPGSTFSNTAERDTYPSEAKAAMTLAEVEKWLATFLVDVYQERPHSALGISPRERYEQGILGDGNRASYPRRCMDETRLRLDFLPFEKRTIQPYGIMLDDIHYFSDVLRPWIHARDPSDPRRKRRFAICRDPRDISVVYFWDPEIEQYFAVPYRDTSHPALSLWELREIRRRLREKGTKAPDEDLLFQAYERMRRLEEEAVRKTASERRKQQRRPVAAHQVIVLPNPSDESPAKPLPFGAAQPFEEMEEMPS